MSNAPVRAGEKKIQDDFQRQLEAGMRSGQKVMLWSSAAHERLRFDPFKGRPRRLVIMESLPQTDDRAYGKERKGIPVGVKGLIDAIEEINGAVFARWLRHNPKVTLSVRDLAMRAASHLADLYESQEHGEKTGVWRLMLALGERHAWETLGDFFGRKGDPRYLLAESIPGASTSEPLYYRPCYPSSQSARPFLDLPPAWLEKKVGALKNDVLTKAHQEFTTAQSKANQHYWIREYAIGHGQLEYPDFIHLVNGLPLIWTEIKTPEATLKEAIRDFQHKPSYQGAPLCLAANGANAILAGQMAGKLEAWVHYEGNIGDQLEAPDKDPGRSQKYLVEQLLSRPERLEFLLIHAGAAIANKNRTGLCYQVGRSQQYQALAHLARDLAWTEVCNSVLRAAGKPEISLGNRLVRHTQRTGKTHTMVRALQLALGCFRAQFRLAIVQVGEVDILAQIYEELARANVGLADRGLPIYKVESRQALDLALAQERSQEKKSLGRILLANTQKISGKDTDAAALPDSSRAFVVVDEGHLGQTGMTADVRDLIFPEASHLLLTATPKDGMSRRYGIGESEVLDDFGYALAQKADMVCPVVYKRRTYQFENNDVAIGALVERLKGALPSSFGDEEIYQAMRDITVAGIDEENEERSSHATQLARQIRRLLEREMEMEWLNAMADALDEYKKTIPLGVDGKPLFRPRMIVFGRDTESVLGLLGKVQELAQAGGAAAPALRNVFRGYRFAVDVSDFGKDPSGNPRTFEHFNPSISDRENLKVQLETDDAEHSVDILLAVGKYTKGYNNDQLAIVALLRNIGEPSLMNQVYTRPATKREGKPAGICLDLAFGRRNVATWEQSLALYDQGKEGAGSLQHLYTEDKVAELVKKVKESLSKTAATISFGLDQLTNAEGVLAAFEAMTDQERSNKGRQFILLARQTAELMARMPDSSLYGEMRQPLVGMRRSLSKLKAFYPELLEDTSLLDDNLSGGYTPQALGEILRAALQDLDNLGLKNLLGIEMGAEIEISAASGTPLGRLADKRAARATEAALKEMLGGGGEEGEQPAARPLRADTVLAHAIQRTLDKLRDDYVPASGEAPRSMQKLNEELEEPLQAWQASAQREGGELRLLMRMRLERLVHERAALLGLSAESLALGLGGLFDILISQASVQATESFEEWQAHLPADVADHPPSRLVPAWLSRYPHKSLADFMGEVSSQMEQEDKAEWLAQLIGLCPNGALRKLLGEDRSDPTLADAPHLLPTALQLALEARAVIHEALALNASRLAQGALE